MSSSALEIRGLREYLSVLMFSIFT